MSNRRRSEKTPWLLQTAGLSPLSETFQTRAAPRWALAVALLLLFWASRLPALDLFPLHIDEGVYLTRAVQVWNLHPFWEISDGRIINHWLIALFYPQNAPVFIARIPTVMVASVGMAAGYALVRELFGTRAAALAGVLWLASPYLFFFERQGLCDAQPGALVVVTLWASLRLARRGRYRDAVLVGLALSAATLYKFSAAPFAATVLVVVLSAGNIRWRRRAVNLAIIGAVGLACFAAPLLYLAWRGGSFDIALGVLGVDAARGSYVGQFLGNLELLWSQLTGYRAVGWAAALLAGLALLIGARSDGASLAYQSLQRGGPRIASATSWAGARLLLAGLLPFLAIMVLGKQIFPRNFAVVFPLALVLAGAGLGAAVNRVRSRRARWAATGALVTVLAAELMAFARTAYSDPANLPLPALVRDHHVTNFSAGYGLREAVGAFPETIQPPDAPVVASMYPDSCRRANFYDTHGFNMLCTDAPGLDAIYAALSERGLAYVLAEAPPVGLDVTTLDMPATRVAGYPRPGETETTASVVLWRLEAAPGDTSAPE